MPGDHDPVLPPARRVAGTPDDATPFDLDQTFEPRPVAVDEPHLLKEVGSPDRFAWRARIRANPLALFWYRIGVGVAGAVLMIAAGLTGWLPGPGGIPLFLLGLAVWASEFDWANGVLMYFKRAFDRLQQLSPRNKRIFWTLVVVAVLFTWYGLAWYSGIPSWLPDPVEDGLRRLPGLA